MIATASNPAFIDFDSTNTPLEKITDSFLDDHHVTLFIKREDLIHKHISGNKWHKLKRNLQYAAEQEYKQVVSFGGAYSNHIHALAFAAPLFGLQAVGVIRSDERVINPTLSDAVNQGMKIHYVSRQEYKERDNPDYLKILQGQYPNALILPEGGNNTRAVEGCGDIIKRIDEHQVDYDAVCVAVGTGGTMAGVVKAIAPHRQVLGFSVLKGDAGVQERIRAQLAEVGAGKRHNWQVLHDYHHGGYAKVSDELVCFMKHFMDKTGIALEPIYTGKMLFGLYSMIKQKHVAEGSRIVAVHTGGLQGLRGMPLTGIPA